MMNILFTSVGRRVELIQCFQSAAEQLNIDLTICGSDLAKDAPALYFCDKIVEAPRVTAKNYIPELLRICQEEKIDALVPTTDRDLLVLSQHKQCFDEIGTVCVISREEKIKICRDKRLTADYFHSLGLESPNTYDNIEKYDAGFPAFIKPLDGSSSISAYRVETKEELKGLCQMVPDYIIQPCITGTEYTVDVFCDFNGNPIYITPRIRLAVRSGEVLKTKVDQDKQIIDETKMIINDFRPVGAITIQLIRDINKKDYFIEINPRFGGGAPLSIKAGADSTKAMLQLLQSKELAYVEKAAEDQSVFSRFDQSIRIR